MRGKLCDQSGPLTWRRGQLRPIRSSSTAKWTDCSSKLPSWLPMAARLSRRKRGKERPPRRRLVSWLRWEEVVKPGGKAFNVVQMVSDSRQGRAYSKYIAIQGSKYFLLKSPSFFRKKIIFPRPCNCRYVFLVHPIYCFYSLARFAHFTLLLSVYFSVSSFFLFIPNIPSFSLLPLSPTRQRPMPPPPPLLKVPAYVYAIIIRSLHQQRCVSSTDICFINRDMFHHRDMFHQ
jgi:hypothetical protein